MLVLESRPRVQSSQGCQETAAIHSKSARTATGSLSASQVARTRQTSGVLSGTKGTPSRRLPCKEQFEQPQTFMHMPPFLQPLVGAVLPSDCQSSPAGANAGRESPSEEAKATKEEARLLLGSAPSTAATTTAETSTGASGRVSEGRQNAKKDASLPTTYVSAALPSRLLPKKLPKRQAGGGPLPEAAITLPNEGTSESAPAAPPAAVAAGKGYLAAHQEPLLSPIRPMSPQLTSIRQTAAEIRGQGTAVATCSSVGSGPPLASLVAALAASSLRLASAAEDGLGTSPSDVGGIFRTSQGASEGPTPGYSPDEQLGGAPPGRPTATPPRPRESERRRRHGGSLVPRARTTSRATKGLQAPSDALPYRMIRHDGHQPPPVKSHRAQSWRQIGRSVRMGQEPAEAHGKAHPDIESTPSASSLARSSPARSGAVPLSTGAAQCCCSSSILAPAGRTATSYSESSSVRQADGSEHPITTHPPPAGVRDMASGSLSSPDRFMNPRRPPPLVEDQQHDGIALEADGNSWISAPEEEGQFALLLQHSMGLLRREAARCFASSQASVKQKLWGELQQERLLRLQEQQHHHNAAAVAAAEIASLRARSIEDHRRAERLLGLCCRRKEAEEALRLLVTSWRAWQQQRLLMRRRKQLHHLLQRRRLLLLLMRTFSPWRAAAARCASERQQQKAQKLLQQELQRLEQVHLDWRQQQKQQVLQLRQQVACEKRLRDCLQQSLVWIVAGGGLGTLAKAVPQPLSSDVSSAAVSATSPRAKSSQKQGQHGRWQQHAGRQRKPLEVVGLHSDLKKRSAPERQRQQHQEQLHQECLPPPPCWQVLASPTQSMQVPVPFIATCATASETSRGPKGMAERRVKFFDDTTQQQQQHQQHLLLLASLLAMPPSSRPTGDEGQMSGSPGRPSLVWPWGRKPTELSNSASAPAVACWGSCNKRDGPESTTALPADIERPNNKANGLVPPHDCPLPTQEALERNITYKRAISPPWGLHSRGPFEADDQLPKERRWTVAAQLARSAQGLS